jgi:hypothetical protein
LDIWPGRGFRGRLNAEPWRLLSWAIFNPESRFARFRVACRRVPKARTCHISRVEEDFLPEQQAKLAPILEDIANKKSLMRSRARKRWAIRDEIAAVVARQQAQQQGQRPRRIHIHQRGGAVSGARISRSVTILVSLSNTVTLSKGKRRSIRAAVRKGGSIFSEGFSI